MSPLEELRATVARLRGPDGCPWDREQTHESLLPCLIEECAEVLEAVDLSDFELLEEELGDILLSVFMHAQIAEENGRFSLDDVAQGINRKLVRRHPHVFGPKAGPMGTERVLAQWEEIKAAEKAEKGVATEGLFKNLPPRLPALYYAAETAKCFRKNNLPRVPSFDPNGLNDAVEAQSAAESLFKLAALCDAKGWDPESLLRQQCDRVRSEAESAHP